jgi:predicted nucleotidyltransferase
MAANYEAIKQEAIRYADDARRELSIERVFLFGSYAKGNADELSDVDVAFFIRDFGEKTRFDIGLVLLRLTHNYKSYFEPLVFSTSEITRGNPFVHEILSTGIEI